MTATAVVHIAGPMIEGVQKCSRCGVTLIDYRGAAVLVMPGESTPKLGGWQEGGHILQDGNMSAVTFEMVTCGGGRVQ